MGVTFPFFVFVSVMGVVISLVAIPLRENARIYSCERPGLGWKICLDALSILSAHKRLKLLKLQTLRIDDD